MRDSLRKKGDRNPLTKGKECCLNFFPEPSQVVERMNSLEEFGLVPISYYDQINVIHFKVLGKIDFPKFPKLIFEQHLN